MPAAFGFSEADIARISAVVHAFEGGSLTPKQLADAPPFERNFGPVPFRNDSGEACPGWAVMRVTGMETVDEQAIFKISKPDATYRWMYLVNSREEVANGKRGWGTWLWQADYVLYNTSNTPAYGERWCPTASSWVLQKSGPGFLIQGSNKGTGTESRTAAIQLPPGEVRVQNDSGGAIAAGGTGTVNLFGGAAGTTDLGLELAVTNGSSVSWATTKYGWVTADAGGLNFVSPYQT